MKRILLVAAVVVAVVAAVALLPSCLALYFFQSDPEHLPCDFSTDPNGACLKGYVCVTVEDGDPNTNDAHPECLKAAQKVKGDTCGRSEECASGLVCATEYARCLANPDDINCSLIDDADKHAACRTKCDLSSAAKDCAADEFCFADADVQFCQVGTCAEEGDCNRGANSAFCVGETVLGGRTGQCFEKCNPLSCAGGVCPDCTGVDGQVDADTNCIPILDEATLRVSRMQCFPSGGIAPFAPCDPLVGDVCQFFAFCNATLTTPVCTPYCDAGGGNPACDAGHQCNAIETGSNVGFCL